MFNTSVKSVLLCVCETWKATKYETTKYKCYNTTSVLLAPQKNKEECSIEPMKEEHILKPEEESSDD